MAPISLRKITITALAKRFIANRPTIYNGLKARLKLFIPLTSKNERDKSLIMALNVWLKFKSLLKINLEAS